MSKQLGPNDRLNGSSARLEPEHQDALDMLVNWVQMARNLGLDVETLFNADKGRLAVRVNGVRITDDGNVVMAGEVQHG